MYGLFDPDKDEFLDLNGIHVEHNDLKCICNDSKKKVNNFFTDIICILTNIVIFISNIFY